MRDLTNRNERVSGLTFTYQVAISMTADAQEITLLLCSTTPATLLYAWTIAARMLKLKGGGMAASCRVLLYVRVDCYREGTW